MWSESGFLHYNAFGCAPNGDKVEWSGGGFGGPPTIATRCWNPPNQKCTDEDYEKIRDIGLHPYPVEYVENALTYLIELDDVDENAESEFRGILMDIKQYVKDGNIDKAKEIMEWFMQKVKQECEKDSISKRAVIVLLATADRFINTN